MSAPDWEEAMGWWKNQPEPIRSMIHTVAVRKFVAHAGPDQGCGSSDTNHTVYGMYQSYKHYEAYQEGKDLPVSVVEFLMEESEEL
jgi:hypothetical protein